MKGNNPTKEAQRKGGERSSQTQERNEQGEFAGRKNEDQERSRDPRESLQGNVDYGEDTGVGQTQERQGRRNEGDEEGGVSRRPNR